MVLARSLACRQRRAYPTAYARASSNFIPCEARGERRQVSAGASPFRELTSGIPRGDRRNALLQAPQAAQERGIVVLVEKFTSDTSFRTKRQTHAAARTLFYGAVKC